MKENRAKRKLQKGEIATVIAGFNSPEVIDFLGPVGFDAVWLEGEHGPVGFDQMGDLTRACDLWGMTPITRIHDNNTGLITRYLDTGTLGIVVPHVNTRQEAEHLVHAGKFAPIGNRGMYGGRQSYGVQDYFKKANDETMLIVLIEEITAVRNLDEILKVDNIDVFFVAPSDLAQTMGHIGNIGHPDVQRTIDEALTRIIKAGRIAGTTVNETNVRHYVDLGVKMIHTGWPGWVAAGGKRFLDLTRGKA